MKKRRKINCVKMVQRIRSLPKEVQARCAGTDRPKNVEKYMRVWAQYILSHDIGFWWEAWEEAHEDYEDHLKEEASKKEELQKAV